MAVQALSSLCRHGKFADAEDMLNQPGNNTHHNRLYHNNRKNNHNHYDHKINHKDTHNNNKPYLSTKCVS